MYFFIPAYKGVGQKPKPNANHVECSFETPPGQGQYCQVIQSDLITGPCTPEQNYGYDSGTPCILIKLNKVRRPLHYAP